MWVYRSNGASDYGVMVPLLESRNFSKKMIIVKSFFLKIGPSGLFDVKS